jgi:glutamate racemase
MLIENQAPPSDENISIRQSHREILIVFQEHMFRIISPFTSYLRKVLQAVTEKLASGENNFIRKTESNFLIVVCSHFPHLSYRFRILLMKMHRQQQRRPIGENVFNE